MKEFDKKGSVLKDGEVVDTGNRILSPCIGHGTYLATGTIVAPGRAIPKGTCVTPDYCKVVQKINTNGKIPDYQQVTKTTSKVPDAS